MRGAESTFQENSWESSNLQETQICPQLYVDVVHSTCSRPIEMCIICILQNIFYWTSCFITCYNDLCDNRPPGVCRFNHANQWNTLIFMILIHIVIAALFAHQKKLIMFTIFLKLNHKIATSDSIIMNITTSWDEYRQQVCVHIYHINESFGENVTKNLTKKSCIYCFG